MKSPCVSFVVPCYRLAHLLSECVESILAQKFDDFEILIMDDCSPDHTAEVAQSFKDARVTYVRNDVNLGHLRNYNKGIGMSRGRYVWLISADDFLRSDQVLGRYVALMDDNPRVGYCFCPGVGVNKDVSSDFNEWLEYGRSLHGAHDRIIPGHELLSRLLKGNTIVAASGLVRKECYENYGAFPLDMPWAGDWYLWCLFALYYDVGYFSEPMVCYREHELSMTNRLWCENVDGCCDEDVAIPWVIKQRADAEGFVNVSKCCLSALASIYARSVATTRYGMEEQAMNLMQFEQSLAQGSCLEGERNWLRGRMFAEAGDKYYGQGKREMARKFYRRALRHDWRMAKVRVKNLLLSLGSAGDFLRRSLG